MIELPAQIRDAEISERANAAGIIAPALSSYFHGKPTLNGLLIGYAGVTIPQARKAIASLAGIVRAYSASA